MAFTELPATRLLRVHHLRLRQNSDRLKRRRKMGKPVPAAGKLTVAPQPQI